MALVLAKKFPKHAFINGKPDEDEYRRVIKGLGFGEAKGEMTDKDCRICTDPGKPVAVADIYTAKRAFEARKKGA